MTLHRQVRQGQIEKMSIQTMAKTLRDGLVSYKKMQAKWK